MSRTPWRFAQVSDVLTYSHKLSDGAYRTYVMLLRIQGENETAWIGNKALADERGQSKRTIQRHLQELEDVGAIVRWIVPLEDGTQQRHLHTEVPGLSEDGFFSAAETLSCAGPMASRWRQIRAPRGQGWRTPHVTTDVAPMSPVAHIRRAIEGESLKESTPTGSLFEGCEEAPKEKKPKAKRKPKNAKKPQLGKRLTPEEHQDFLRWWEAYPKHQNVGAARGAWREARAHFPPGERGMKLLMTSTADWVKAKRAEPGFDPQWWPWPASWLRDERWKDELSPVEAAFTPEHWEARARRDEAETRRMLEEQGNA